MPHLPSIGSKKDIDYLFQHGQRHGHRSLKMFYAKRHFLCPTKGLRVVLAVGRRAGNSVIRNRIKRLLREALLERADVCKLDYDLAFVYRGSVQKSAGSKSAVSGSTVSKGNASKATVSKKAVSKSTNRKHPISVLQAGQKQKHAKGLAYARLNLDTIRADITPLLTHLEHH